MLKQLLNLADTSEISTDFPMTVASVGSPKLFVPLRSEEALEKLHPNFDIIKQWSLDNRINGLYVYTPEPTNRLLLQARALTRKLDKTKTPLLEWPLPP